MSLRACRPSFALLLPTFALLATSAIASDKKIAGPIDAPAGTYQLEKTHASLHWRVQHLGLSNYTARFKSFDAVIEFDPAQPARSSVKASIDIGSIETDLAAPDFNAELKSPPFFNAALFPQATFASTRVVPTGPRTWRVTGDLVLLGIKQAVTLEVLLNGAMRAHPFAKVPALGFSATGRVDRLAHGLNPPPLRSGIGSDVDVLIEAEFLLKP